MKLPADVCGRDPIVMRDMFRAFIDKETDWFIDDQGTPVINKKYVDEAFVSGALGISQSEARELCEQLTADDWLEADRPVPTTKAMALAQVIVRPRLARAGADHLVTQVKAWATAVNARVDARIKVKSIELYGSYLTDADDVGDIDMIVTFSTMDLGEDLQPDDMEAEDDLVGELKAISEYLSPATEMDKLNLDASYETLFTA